MVFINYVLCNILLFSVCNNTFFMVRLFLESEMPDFLMHVNARNLYLSGESKTELEKINWKEINHYHSSNS
jgi:hypothetical protein